MQTNNRKYTTGRYTKIYKDGKAVDEHRVIWESINGPIPKGCVIHHVNGDSHDNRIGNLVMMTHKAHMQLHGKLRREGKDVIDSTDLQVIKSRKDSHDYQESHKELCRLRNAKYRAEHKAEEAARKSKYYQENKAARLRYNAEWKKKNIEHVREYGRTHYKEYYLNNIDNIKEKRKQRYEQNKEMILQKNREYAEAHKEQLKQYHDKYNREHREVNSALDRLRRARLRSATDDVIKQLEVNVIKAKERLKNKQS